MSESECDFGDPGSPPTGRRTPARRHPAAACRGAGLFARRRFAAALIWRMELQRLQVERARVTDLAGNHARALQISIERALTAVYALAALVRLGNGTVTNFDALVGEMLPYYPGVSALELAPGGVITQRDAPGRQRKGRRLRPAEGPGPEEGSRHRPRYRQAHPGGADQPGPGRAGHRRALAGVPGRRQGHPFLLGVHPRGDPLSRRPRSRPVHADRGAGFSLRTLADASGQRAEAGHRRFLADTRWSNRWSIPWRCRTGRGH